MKKWIAMVVATSVVIIAIVDTIHGFIADGIVHYFAEQPRRLLMVACVGVAGGLVALAYERLPLRLRRTLKLCTWGSAASLLTLFVGYFLLEAAALPSQLGASEAICVFVVLPLCFGVIIVMLWREFYQVFKRRVE